jgi:hypothetical protein
MIELGPADINKLGDRSVISRGIGSLPVAARQVFNLSTDRVRATSSLRAVASFLCLPLLACSGSIKPAEKTAAQPSVKRENCHAASPATRSLVAAHRPFSHHADQLPQPG